MSYNSAANNPKTNPDTRPLPEGWITQWDANYQAWFYVNVRENPPRSSWVSPLDMQPQASPQPQQNYAPPPGAPLGGAQGYYGGNQSPYPQQQPYGSGSPYPSQSYPQSGPPQNDKQSSKGPLGALAGAGAAGGLLGKLLSHGGKSSHQSQQGYGGHSSGGFGGFGGQGQYGGGGYGGGYGQPQMYQQAPKKSNAGRNTALAAGGGLLGGLLIADAFDDIGDSYQEQQAYDQGYDDGGGDFDGGDF